MSSKELIVGKQNPRRMLGRRRRPNLQDVIPLWAKTCYNRALR
jgi:hypothetical protein